MTTAEPVTTPAPRFPVALAAVHLTITAAFLLVVVLYLARMAVEGVEPPAHAGSGDSVGACWWPAR